MPKTGSGGGGGIGGFARFLLLVGLLAWCGYNTWEIAQLQSEVNRLHGQHRPAANLESGTDAGVLQTGERFLAEAQVHAANARKLAERHNLTEARREAERAAASARDAEATAQSRSAQVLESVRDAAHDLSQKADALLTQLKNDAGTAASAAGRAPGAQVQEKKGQ